MEKASGSECHSCPVCHEPYFGDFAAFENHVQKHFEHEDPPAQEEESKNERDPPETKGYTGSGKQSPLIHSIEDFTIECDAPGCTKKVTIEDIAEHMDRHLAEQIQGQESSDGAFVEQYSLSKDAGGTECLTTLKRLRSYSPDLTLLFKDDDETPRKKVRDDSTASKSESSKRAGQTTMDGFLRRAAGDVVFQEPGTTEPRSSQLTFLNSTPASNVIGIPGLISKTKLLLDFSKTQGITKQAYLADPSVVFCQTDKTDRGWGCGYRNIQMMLSYVVQKPVGAPATTSFNPTIPTIKDLQQQLEFAWTIGFDTAGARQLGCKVEGTRKWIGTTEAWAVLCSLGIRCSILDFHSPTGPNGTHPAMLAAIYEYFSAPAWSPLTAPQAQSFAYHVQQDSDQRVIQTAKPPLYMQHQGHSRTIIGIEVLETGNLNLLVFDPDRWLHKSIPVLREELLSKALSPSLGSKSGVVLDAQYFLKAFRLPVCSGVSKSQYQLLGISGLYEDGDGGTSSKSSAHGSTSRSNNRDGAPPRILRMCTKNASLSIGWSDEEAEHSKFVFSTRVP